MVIDPFPKYTLASRSFSNLKSSIDGTILASRAISYHLRHGIEIEQFIAKSAQILSSVHYSQTQSKMCARWCTRTY